MRRSLNKVEYAAASLSIALELFFITLFAAVVFSPDDASATTTSTSPVSASFLRSGEGWILSGYHCSSGICVAVKRTVNDGRTWTSLPLPSHLRTVGDPTSSNYFPLVQQNIYFANAMDGWIYGSAPIEGSGAETFTSPNAEIWSTHNGGAAWFAVDTKSLGMKFDILTVAASRGSVYALSWRNGQALGLWHSSVADDAWHRISTPALHQAAGGSNMEGALIFKGANGWLMAGNDRGATASARLTASGRWVTWSAPCDNVGNSFSAPIAYNPTTLVDVCTIGGFGGDVATGTPHFLKLQSNWVYTSHDAGLTFAPTSRVVVDGSSKSLDQLPSLPASPGQGKILVAKSVSHGVKVSDHLFLTQNGGATWSSVYATPLSGFFPLIQFVSFASSSFGYAIVQRSRTTSALIITTDGGLTWRTSAT